MNFHGLRKDKDKKRADLAPHPHTHSHKKDTAESKDDFPHIDDETLDELKLDFAYFKMATRRALSNFLILFSVYIFAWVFLQPALEEAKFVLRSLAGTEYVVADSLEDAAEDPTFNIERNTGQANLLSDFLGTQKVQPLVPVDPAFSIVIPRLGANARVISNVDTVNEDVYLDALEQGVAHAAGTALPGQNQHVYLFAHSTNTFSNVSRYNAIFYLLYKLEEGDEINVYYNGIRHKYAVTGSTIVDPSEVQYLTRKTDSEFLTLQTCWPPGTVAQRMLVFAEPVAQ